MANAQVLKALVVDDSFMIRGIHKRMLIPKGFEVTEAENGKVAVDYFHDGNEYDLVLMDKEMPVMDGVKATKTLKEEGVNAKIVAITADENAIGVFVEAGADAFVVKPLSTAKLDNLLKNFNFTN